MSKQKSKKKEKEKEVSREEVDQAEQDATSTVATNTEIVGPLPIAKLEGNGIVPADVKRLKDAGYHTVESVAFVTRRHLMSIKGVSENKADKIIEQAAKLIPMGFTTATAFNSARSDIIQISTGSKNLDKLLDGGIETGSITELFGEFRTGKTQLVINYVLLVNYPLTKAGEKVKPSTLTPKGPFDRNDAWPLLNAMILMEKMF